jgi:hypothetical protein
LNVTNYTNMFQDAPAMISTYGNISSFGTSPEYTPTAEFFNQNNPVPPTPTHPIYNSRGGPINICGTKTRNCNNYGKNLPGSSGNQVITGWTRATQITTAVNVQQYVRGARWVRENVDVNQFGSRAGAPAGYGQPIRNSFN